MDGEVKVRLDNLPEYLVEKGVREGKLTNLDRDMLLECGSDEAVPGGEKKEINGILKLQPAGIAVAKRATAERVKLREQRENPTLKTRMLYDMENIVRAKDGKVWGELKVRAAPGGYAMGPRADDSPGAATAELTALFFEASFSF